MELNQQRIEDAIIADVTEKLISDDDLWERAKRAFDARIDKLWREAAEPRIRSEIELAIAQGFERSYCKVDSFGNPCAETTTIRAELDRIIGGYWNEKVGRDGKPATYHAVTRAEWMMAKLCAEDFGKEMQKHIVNVGGAVKDHFRTELHNSVNKLLSDVFHVKSLGDQGKGREIIDPPAQPIGS